MPRFGIAASEPLDEHRLARFQTLLRTRRRHAESRIVTDAARPALPQPAQLDGRHDLELQFGRKIAGASDGDGPVSTTSTCLAVPADLSAGSSRTVSVWCGMPF